MVTRKRLRLMVGLVCSAIALTVSSCAVPTTHFEPLSPAMLYAEELKQQKLVIEWQVRQLRRLENVGHGLLVAANVYCSQSAAPRLGLLLLNTHDFGAGLTDAARANSFSDTVTIANVAIGSSAEKAGLRAGDRVVSLFGSPTPTGRGARDAVARLVVQHSSTDNVAVEILRKDENAGTNAITVRRSFSFVPEKACPDGVVLLRDDADNAYADGKTIFVTSAMLRFVENDDQLSTVLAHEIAHNAMGHIQIRQRNGILGALLGAIVDIGAATQGLNTGGEFSKSGATAGALAFSQDFEREADYVGAYIHANAGRPIANSPEFWRRMAQENPKSITFAGSHPTTAERFVRLDASVSEIERKLARGEALRRELRAPSPVLADNGSNRARTAPRSTIATPSSEAPSIPALSIAALAARRDSGRASAPVAALTSRRDETRPTRNSQRRGAPTLDAPMSMPLDPASRSFEWGFGPPVARAGLSLEEVVAKARRSYGEGVQAREAGWGERARDYFYEATQLDGSVASYQAALGELLLRQGFRAEAQAVLSAATLLDPENPAYRRLLGESRR